MTQAFSRKGQPTCCYLLGSQSEGKATPDMGSDLDCLHYRRILNIFDDLNDWIKGEVNHRMIRDELAAPRHCFLELYDLSLPCPTPVIPEIPGYVDFHGRYLFQNTFNLER